MLLNEAIEYKSNYKPKKIIWRLRISSKQRNPLVLYCHCTQFIPSSQILFKLQISFSIAPPSFPPIHLKKVQLKEQTRILNNANDDILGVPYFLTRHFFLFLLFILHIHNNKQLPLHHMARNPCRCWDTSTIINWIPVRLGPKCQHSNYSRMVRTTMGKDRVHFWRVRSWKMSNRGLWRKAGMWWHGCHSTCIPLWDNAWNRQWVRFLWCQPCRWLQYTAYCRTKGGIWSMQCHRLRCKYQHGWAFKLLLQFASRKLDYKMIWLHL